ncbi:MAG TPA: TAXI family TRAP transporter solute-binding subunit [Candidatus Limnocylindria bacterium]|nr:TAXI family TRAP transporter solute-binding subunit [Candidatus Limnocylindria bacterium]
MQKLAGALVTGFCLVSAVVASAETVGFTTLQPGAINHLQAQIIGKVVQAHSDLQIRVIPVAGTTATLAAVQNKQAEFTIGDVNNMADAINGADMFRDLKPMPNLRVVVKLVDFPIGIMVRKDSGMSKLEDLKGKRYPVGWQAFPNGIPLSLGVLATAGMTLDDVKGINVSGLIPAADDFKTGKLDATMIAPPAPKVKEVDAAVGGIRWLAIPDTPEALARVQKVKPDYGIMTVRPPSPLVGVTEPTNFLRIHVLITAGTHVGDATVYKFAKAMVEHRAELVKGHPIFNGFHTDKRMAVQFTSVKYHPGAIKYFKEKGLWDGP